MREGKTLLCLLDRLKKGDRESWSTMARGGGRTTCAARRAQCRYGSYAPSWTGSRAYPLRSDSSPASP